MQDFCPLCLKNGVKKKVKLLQINLQEAIWACEGEKCIWPFGYEDFTFFPRTIGKIWSCYWDNQKPVTRTRETILSSVEPTSSSTPRTTCENILAGCVNNTDSTAEKSQSVPEDIISTNLVTKNDLDDIDLATFTQKCSKMQRQKSNIFVNNTKLFDESTKSNTMVKYDNIKVSVPIFMESNNTNLVDNQIKLSDQNHENLTMQNNLSVNGVKGIPLITNIQKTNIDISNVKMGNPILIHQDSDTKTNINALKNTPEKKIISEPNTESPIHLSLSQNSVKPEVHENNENSNETAKVKPNLNVTTIKIDSLPPIQLSYEFPLQINYETNTSINIPKKIEKLPPRTTQFFKRSVTSGKSYEKFSFSAIKKKVDSNSSNNIKNGITTKKMTSPVKQDVKDDNVTRITQKENPLTQPCRQVKSITTDCTLNETSTPSASSVNNNESIETALEGFLMENYNISDVINDDWINSLLN